MVRKMNEKEAIRLINELLNDSSYTESYSGSSNEPMNVALNMAISALEKQSIKTEKIFKFNYGGRNHLFNSDKDLYENFLVKLDYENVGYDENYINIDLANGNELKIKLL